MKEKGHWKIIQNTVKRAKVIYTLSYQIESPIYSLCICHSILVIVIRFVVGDREMKICYIHLLINFFLTICYVFLESNAAKSPSSEIIIISFFFYTFINILFRIFNYLTRNLCTIDQILKHHKVWEIHSSKMRNTAKCNFVRLFFFFSYIYIYILQISFNCLFSVCKKQLN